MKKLFLLLMSAVVSTVFSFGIDIGKSEYYIDFTVAIKGAHHSNRCDNHFEISTIPATNIIWREDIKEPDDRWKYPTYSGGHIFESSTQSVIFNIEGIRKYRRKFTCEGSSSNGSITQSYLLTNITNTILLPVPGWSGNITATIYPYDILLDARNPLTLETTGLFPTDDRIDLLATPGFASAVYQWQYSFVDDNNDIYWTNLPSKYQGKPSINISGKDLFGDNVYSLYQTLRQDNKSIYFRINCRTRKQEESEPLFHKKVLTPSYSAPHLSILSTQSTQCFGGADGSITIRLDRTLYEGESLLLDYENLDYNVFGSKPITPNNNYYILTDLSEGNYSIQISGYYNGGNLFSDGNEHKIYGQITSPTEVTFSSTKKDISCYGGSDGVITVNASGGTAGGYKLYWKEENEEGYQTQDFEQANETRITGLLPKSYEYYVRDVHNCYWKNSDGTIKTTTTTLSQPAEPVDIQLIELIEPSGYHLSNGWIIVEVKGGTPSNDGSYNVQWKNKQDQLQSDFSTEVDGEVFRVRLNNVRANTYTLIITDKNGCIYTAEYEVTEPDELLANIEETHFVSCFGMSDGEITAHITGGVKNTNTNQLPYRYQWYVQTNGVYNAIPYQTDSILTNISAGYYKVEIIDYSRIPNTTSKIYRLTEPFLLVTSVPDKEIVCNQTTGLSASTVGGTAPYSYEWNTGDFTQSLSGLGAGKYFVFVTDTRGCQAKAMGTISMPSDLEIEGFVTGPVCYQTSTGNIQLQIKGGSAPYTCLWSNGIQAKDLSNLKAGKYTVTVIDNDGCNISDMFELADPERLTVSLGGDRALCNGQELVLAPSVADPNTTFEWTGTTGFQSTESQVTLREEGIYKLAITDSKGCEASDRINIKLRSYDISSEMVVSSQATVKDTVILANISDPEPYRIEWLVESNQQMEVVEKSLYYAKVIFKDTGNYVVGMRAHLEDCYQEVMKNIVVIDGDDSFGSFDQSIIKEFILYPNPNTGIFTAEIELSQVAPVRLRIINLGLGMLMDDRRLAGKETYSESYNLSLGAGVYILVLDVESERMNLKMVVK
jgi:hypothetical protein